MEVADRTSAKSMAAMTNGLLAEGEIRNGDEEHVAAFSPMRSRGKEIKKSNAVTIPNRAQNQNKTRIRRMGLKKGIQLSRMNVTSNHSESGRHEDIMLVPDQVCQLDFLVPVLF
jgi:hypothetical protein